MMDPKLVHLAFWIKLLWVTRADIINSGDDFIRSAGCVESVESVEGVEGVKRSVQTRRANMKPHQSCSILGCLNKTILQPPEKSSMSVTAMDIVPLVGGPLSLFLMSMMFCNTWGRLPLWRMKYLSV